ncbi:MAG TPA: TIR domain-containing protein [Terrimicrobiaceae bacterium]
MADIFVSYSTADRTRVSAVSAALEQHGWSVWWDREIFVGSSWDEAIEQEIARARSVLVLWSPSAVTSEWVKNEARDAKQRHILLPALIERTKLPIEFRHIQTADLTSWKPGEPNVEFDKLLVGLHRLLDELKKRDSQEDVEATETPIGEQTSHGKPILGGLPSRQQALTSQVKPLESGPLISSGRSWRAWLWAGIGTIVLLAAALILWNSIAAAPSGIVRLVDPAPGATVLGSLLFSWSAKDLKQSDLQFELWVSDASKPPLIRRITRNSYRMDDLMGPLKWKVRPVWRRLNGEETRGEWSEERALTFYPSALDRILATRTIHVGTGESEGIYVRNENGRLTGFDIELLRRIGAAILQAHQIQGEAHIAYTYRVWGDEYFRLLAEDPTVDLLASGISITSEREKEYGLVFSRPILRYPQTIVTAGGKKPFVDGKLALSRLGVVEKTTSEELAKRLIGSSVDQLKIYNNSGAYDTMFSDLLAQKIEGILLDKPYALQKAEEFSRNRPTVSFAMVDVAGENFVDVEPEKIGWAVRPVDRSLLDEVNKQLEQQKPSKAELIKEFFPNPEVFLPD